MDLPNDVVLDILTWLPLDKLGKIRSLSKFHANATYHSYFKKLAAQRQRGPILDGFLFQTLALNSYVSSFASPLPDHSPPFKFSLDFLPGRRHHILAAAPNGLLLCQSHHPTHHHKQFYTICKPSTKQWKGLPIPRTRYFTTNIAMFVLSSNPLRFKILRLSQNRTPSRRNFPFCYTVCELFDSVTWRWRPMNDMVHESYSTCVDVFSAAVMAAGSAHWKFCDETSIFAFDFYSETWSSIPMPDVVVAEYDEMKNDDEFMAGWRTELVEYQGKLGLMRQLDGPAGSTELWVMDNYCNRIWTKRFGSLESMPMALYGSDVSMTWMCNDEVRFSSLESDGWSWLKSLEERHHGRPMMVYPFVSDFEEWNFEPPPRTIKPRTMAKILRKRLLLIQDNVLLLSSFSLFFALYNQCFCNFLLGILEFTLQNS